MTCYHTSLRGRSIVSVEQTPDSNMVRLSCAEQGNGGIWFEVDKGDLVKDLTYVLNTGHSSFDHRMSVVRYAGDVVFARNPFGLVMVSVEQAREMLASLKS